MTLPADVLTDLVILYHAHEASTATRELLETEAKTNPSLAAALAAAPRAATPIAAGPADMHMRVIRDVRRGFRFRLIFLSLAMAALLSMLFPRPQSETTGPWFPLGLLLFAFGCAFIALRAHSRLRRRF